MHFNTQFLRYLHGSSLLNRSFSVPPSAATEAASSPPPPPPVALLLLVQEKAAAAAATTTAISCKSGAQTATTNAQRHDTTTHDSLSPSQTVGRWIDL